MTDALEDLPIHFEDLATGQSFTTGGRTVTEADVVNFAGLSGDFHSLHMDETFAAGTPHGRRIAHGMLIVSMTAGLVARLPLMRGLERTTIGLASVNCRFLRPTFIGDTIRVRVEVQEKQEGRKPDRGSVVLRRSVTNQNDEVVVEGLWTLAVRRRTAA
ncbi:acyl dehydratase [Ramlibacter henchirensis]|uniref:Acyl dehydratase n=1 Tax=Ramlibacter henchirensis TaxID=204072 RepID=A0A4Z0BX29_9BURK|nr:MaoC/PaaZ C-terminal domain-containing protein [Ramlibacter henchirensis]TFZ02818.1 acyl dehydratase [Ramlibacter henchirensis]